MIKPKSNKWMTNKINNKRGDVSEDKEDIKNTTKKGIYLKIKKTLKCM